MGSLTTFLMEPMGSFSVRSEARGVTLVIQSPPAVPVTQVPHALAGTGRGDGAGKV